MVKLLFAIKSLIWYQELCFQIRGVPKVWNNKTKRQFDLKQTATHAQSPVATYHTPPSRFCQPPSFHESTQSGTGLFLKKAFCFNDWGHGLMLFQSTANQQPIFKLSFQMVKSEICFIKPSVIQSIQIKDLKQAYQTKGYSNLWFETKQNETTNW